MFTALVPLLTQLVGLFPNPNDRQKALEAVNNLELEIIKGQLAINTEEAKSTSLFVSGWRPFIGWCCGVGFVYTIIGPVFHFPPVDTNAMITVLTGMLGIGGLRTFEKVKGVTR